MFSCIHIILLMCDVTMVTFSIMFYTSIIKYTSCKMTNPIIIITILNSFLECSLATTKTSITTNFFDITLKTLLFCLVCTMISVIKCLYCHFKLENMLHNESVDHLKFTSPVFERFHWHESLLQYISIVYKEQYLCRLHFSTIKKMFMTILEQHRDFHIHCTCETAIEK